MNTFERDICASDLTIVINTCDSYADVLSLFFCAFKEFWPQCEFDIVINSEKNIYNQYPATTHNYQSNDLDSWGSRFLSVLDSIESEYVLVLYDDFILERSVINSDIIEVIRMMNEEKNTSVCYLVHTSLPLQCSDDGDKRFAKVQEYADFKLNSFPAIWRREDLISYTGKNDNPWAWEVFGTYRTYNSGKFFLSLKPEYPEAYHYNHSKGGAIYRGRWVKSVVEDKFMKYGLSIDPSLRGFSEDTAHEKRSVGWKIKFIKTGYKMVGFRVLLFIYRYIKAKVCEKVS